MVETQPRYGGWGVATDVLSKALWTASQLGVSSEWTEDWPYETGVLQDCTKSLELRRNV